jgi:hypothetical protein
MYAFVAFSETARRPSVRVRIQNSKYAPERVGCAPPPVPVAGSKPSSIPCRLSHAASVRAGSAPTMSRIICQAARLSAPSGAGPIASETEHCGQKHIRCAEDFWRGLTPTVCANKYTATDFCPASNSRLQRRQYRLSKSPVSGCLQSCVHATVSKALPVAQVCRRIPARAGTKVYSSQKRITSRTLLPWAWIHPQSSCNRPGFRKDANRSPPFVTASANAALNSCWFKLAADVGSSPKAALNPASRTPNPLPSRLFVANPTLQLLQKMRGLLPDLSIQSLASRPTFARCLAWNRRRNRTETRPGFPLKKRSNACSKTARRNSASNSLASSTVLCCGIQRLHSGAPNPPIRMLRDALQRVRFEAFEDGRGHGDLRRAALARHFLRQRGDAHSSAAIEAAAQAHFRQVHQIGAPEEIRRPVLRLGTGAGSPAETAHNITAIDSGRSANLSKSGSLASSKHKIPGKLAGVRPDRSSN